MQSRSLRESAAISYGPSALMVARSIVGSDHVPSSERECRDVISAHAARSPDLDPVDGVTGDSPSERAIDRAYDAAIRWPGVIAETYECAAEFGPQAGGDKVLAEHAAALYLVALALEDPSIDAVINSAMVGIQKFYPKSCFAASAETWVQEKQARPRPDERVRIVRVAWLIRSTKTRACGPTWRRSATRGTSPDP